MANHHHQKLPILLEAASMAEEPRLEVLFEPEEATAELDPTTLLDTEVVCLYLQYRFRPWYWWRQNQDLVYEPNGGQS